MFVTPGIQPDLGRKLTRDVAQRIARNWWLLLLNGALLVVAGVLIFSIDWTIRDLATFIGALFIFQGVADALTTGLDARVRQANVITGLLSIGAGILIIVWPDPGLVAIAVVLGSWLIVTGTIEITAAFAARRLVPGWWMMLILGLIQIPLGVLALADPGATLAALITVAGIWAAAIGVMRIVLAFEIKQLPDDVEKAWTARDGDRGPRAVASEQSPFAASGS